LSRTWELPITEPGDLRPIFQSEHIAREQARFKDPEWLKKR
jgi:hypothetical protein